MFLGLLAVLLLLGLGLPLVVILVLIVVLIAVLILVLIAVLILILVLIAVFHWFISSEFHFADWSAPIAYPLWHYLSLDLKISPANQPKTTAAAMPPAVAVRPPVKIPRKPFSSTASLTPLARE